VLGHSATVWDVVMDACKEGPVRALPWALGAGLNGGWGERSLSGRWHPGQRVAGWAASWCRASWALCALVLVLAFWGPVWAGPGAHGPHGEHLGETAGAAQAGQVAGLAVPRIEAVSRHYELVGRLVAGELSLMIDHFASNAPVLGAWVEVQAHGLKARAVFHADQGDYAVDDAALLKALAAPGEHALQVTVRALPGGADLEADVLAGVLKPPASGSVLVGHDHDHAPHWPWWLLGGLLGLAAVAGLWRRRARAATPFLSQGAAP
jgi:hypothetical protein